MRALVALLFVAGPAGAAGPPIDLDAPGVLQSLRERNPAHYEKIQAIIVLAEARPTGQFREGGCAAPSPPPRWRMRRCGT